MSMTSRAQHHATVPAGSGGLAWLDRTLEYCTAPRGLIGSSVWRLSTGLCVLYWYMAHYANRRYLWGPDGVVPFHLLDDIGWTARFSLYALTPSTVIFEILFHAGLIVAALFAMGWRTRVSAPLNLVFHYSLYNRNHYFPNAGDNLAVLVQLMLLFAHTSAHVSLDAQRHRSRLADAGRGMDPVRSAVHNAALVASVAQLCTLYMIAGMHKVSGDMWSSGTALYYVLQVAEYAYPPYSNLIVGNDYAVVVLSYATVVFQIGFTFAVLTRASRLCWLAGGLLFHAGVAVMMGLVTFSWFVVSTYALLVADDDYLRFFRRIRSWMASLRARMPVRARTAAGNPAPGP